jgi:hypothetical protein
MDSMATWEIDMTNETAEREAFEQWFTEHYVRMGFVSSKHELLTAWLARAASPLMQNGPEGETQVRPCKSVTECRDATQCEIEGRCARAPAAVERTAQDDPWLRDRSLLYRLTDERHPQNRDEINVTMANGSRSDAAREARAVELLSLLSEAAPQQGGESALVQATREVLTGERKP